MDLFTIKGKLDKGDYAGKVGPARAVLDFRAMFHACEVYNADASPIGRAGKILHKLWAKTFEPTVARALEPETQSLLLRNLGALKAEHRAVVAAA